MKAIIGERRENEWENLERVTKHEIPFLTLGNKQRVAKGEVGRRLCNWVSGTEEGT